MAEAWTLQQMPTQAGKRAIVTGANVGLGFQTARALARAGAQVVLACRSIDRGEAAVARIRNEQPSAMVQVVELDLSSLASVHRFAEEALNAGESIDLLVNNAGVMALPKRQLSPDGFELQLATNYLGHFALTGLLLPLLLAAAAPRVVSLSSNAHKRGSLDLDDLQLERSYSPWKAYQQSKLAMLVYARELQRRSDAHGGKLVSVAAHPGLSSTSINRELAGPARFVVPLAFRILGQSDAQGALPQLYASTGAVPEQVERGGYYGPGGFGEFKGAPAAAKPSEKAIDPMAGRALWKLSETLTRVPYTWAPLA